MYVMATKTVTRHNEYMQKVIKKQKRVNNCVKIVGTFIPYTFNGA